MISSCVAANSSRPDLRAGVRERKRGSCEGSPLPIILGFSDHEFLRFPETSEFSFDPIPAGNFQLPHEKASPKF